jgi:hypothetical protein
MYCDQIRLNLRIAASWVRRSADGFPVTYPAGSGVQLLASLAGRPAEIDRFIGAFAGVVPTAEYFAPETSCAFWAYAG